MTLGFRVHENNFTSSTSGKSQIQAKFILELMSIDSERANVLVKCWEQLMQVGASGSKDREFHNLDEYVPWRIDDAGEPYVFTSVRSTYGYVDVIRFWFGIITYGMALTISDDERKLIRQVTVPAFANLALANDFFSWQKEYDDFKQNSEATYMVNAIWIVMKEHSLTIEGAKQMLQDKIAGYCQEYLQLKAEFESSTVVSVDTKRYLSALELTIAGNVGWSQFSPRYRFSANGSTGGKKKSVDGLQNCFDWPENGTKGHPTAIQVHPNGTQQVQSRLISPPTSSVCGNSKEHMMTSSENQVEEFSSFPPSEIDRVEADIISSSTSKVDRHDDTKVLVCRSLPELSDEVLYLLDKQICLELIWNSDLTRALPIHQFATVERCGKHHDRCPQYLDSST